MASDVLLAQVVNAQEVLGLALPGADVNVLRATLWPDGSPRALEVPTANLTWLPETGVPQDVTAAIFGQSTVPLLTALPGSLGALLPGYGAVAQAAAAHGGVHLWIASDVAEPGSPAPVAAGCSLLLMAAEHRRRRLAARR